MSAWVSFSVQPFLLGESLLAQEAFELIVVPFVHIRFHRQLSRLAGGFHQYRYPSRPSLEEICERRAE
jgi:hypothetical protein